MSILFVATEYGSFNVIYPVLKKCCKKYRSGYIGIKDIFENNLVYKDIIVKVNDINYNNFNKFDVFVTGTSMYSNIEYNIWKYARKNSKKSICVLDQCKDYKDRFSRNNRFFFPDIICVMDEKSKETLSSICFDQNRIAVTGSPYLEDVLKNKIDLRKKREIRETLRLYNKKVITFCTEYIAKTKEKEKYGYDELDILKDIIMYIKNRGKDKYKLIVRVHPNDSKTIYEDYLNKIKNIVDFEVITMDSKNKLLQISDVVVGITSTILIEADILGLSIISYQPVKGKKQVYLFNEIIEEKTIISKKNFFKKIDKLLQFPEDSKGLNINVKCYSHNSCKKITRIIEKLIRESLLCSNKS